MPARKPPARPVKCRTCKGTRQVAIDLRPGRSNRSAGRQTALCLTCGGSGTT